jgi:hypothetical protein
MQSTFASIGTHAATLRRQVNFQQALCLAALAVPFLATAVSANGNVRAFLRGSDTVVVVGDSEDNGVFVGRTGGADEILIEGTDQGGAPTTVNGLPAVVVVSSALDIIIELLGGNDRVRVDSQLPGSVTIRSGSGNDVIGIGDPVIAGDLDIDTGSGDDLVDIQDSAVRGDLSIETGPGDDTVFFFFAFLNGDTSIDTGSDDDRILSDESPFGGSLSIDTGSGEDEVSIEKASIGDDLEVQLDSGRDSLTIAETTIDGKVQCDGGRGKDTYTNGDENDFPDGKKHFKHFEKR